LDIPLRRKHALTLQLHTAHILSAHASLQEKSKAIQDIREQKNKYGSMFVPGMPRSDDLSLQVRKRTDTTIECVTRGMSPIFGYSHP